MHMTSRKPLPWFAAAAFVLAALVSFAAPTAASANSIRILVNDEPITTFDIQQRSQMLRVFSRGKAGEKEAIDQLIDEKLMLQEAARRHIDVSDAEVEQEIANRGRAAHMTPAQFDQALRQAGLDPSSFRDFLHANMAWQKTVRARFRATVNITDQDVAAALGANNAPGAQEAVTEYMLQPILFIVPAGASGATANQQLAAANAFRRGFQGCDQSVAQAGGSPGVVVRPQMRREESGLPSGMKAALAKLDIGGTTEPERVDEGFQIVAVCAKNAVAGETQATATARAEISDERGKLLARRYLRDLRSDAVIEYR